MKKITLLLLLLTVSIGYSQTVLEDFEGTAPTVEKQADLATIEVAANPDQSGSNTSAKALKIITSTTAAGWQGGQMIFQGTDHLDLSSTNKSITIKVHSTVATDILAKVSVGGTDSATDASHSGSGWETLTFNFANARDNTSAADAIYSDITFYPAWNNLNGTCVNGCYTGSTSSSAPEITLYIDDITGIAGTPPPSCTDGIMNNGETAIDCGGPNCDACPSLPTTAPATPPSRNAWDVISIYGGAYGTAPTLSGVTWDEGSAHTEETYATNEVLKITNGTSDFIGFDISGSPIDATNMTHVHADFWLPGDYVAGQVVKVKLSNHDKADGTAGESNSIIKELVPAGTDMEKWISLDMEMGTDARAKIKQLILIYTNSEGAASVVYADNIYLYRAATAGVAKNNVLNVSVSPSPAKNTLSISAANTIGTAVIYNVLGKQVKSAIVNSKSASLDVSSLSTGVYILKYSVDNKVGSLKFIKE